MAGAYRFPAGSSGATLTGGRYVSPSTVSSMQMGGPLVMYETRIPVIIPELMIRTRMASKATANAILRTARELVPQPGNSRTGRALGNLRDSLEILELTDLPDGDALASETGGSDYAVGSDLEYAPYVEFGTSGGGGGSGGQPPQPYLIPAVEAHRGEFISSVALALQRL